MKRFEERRRFRSILYSKPVIIILLVLSIVLFRAVWYGYQGRRLAGSNLKIAELEKAEVASRVEALRGEIEKLDTDRGKEEAFRSKLGMVKEGEGVIVLVEPKTVEGNSVLEKKNFWGRIKGIFGFE